MTAVTLPNTGIKAGWLGTEGAWGAEMNKVLRVLDALAQPRVVDKDLAAPPGSPAAGAMYIVGGSPTGAWAGHTNQLALWMVGDDLTSAWLFLTPLSGWETWVIDESLRYRFSGSAWVALP